MIIRVEQQSPTEPSDFTDNHARKLIRAICAFRGRKPHNANCANNQLVKLVKFALTTFYANLLPQRNLRELIALEIFNANYANFTNFA